MKKLLLVMSCLTAVIMLCACGKGGGKAEATPVPELDPTQFFSVEDAALCVGYQPVLDGGAVKRDGNKATALYRSEPVGQGDPIEVTVTQYTDEVPIENVWYEYDTAKSLRSSAEEIAELGENAFIAFPSIHIYDRGCYIKITAGSGSDENQRNQLLTVARTTIAKFEEIVPAPKIEDNAVEQK